MTLARFTGLSAAAVAGAVLLGLAVQGQTADPPRKKAETKEAKADEPPDAEERSSADKWMRVKLRASQEIFEGLTNGECDKIEANARRMLFLNFLEQWQRDNEFTQKSEYEAYLNAFEYATKELIRTSRHDDIDGALDAYVLLSQSCVKCHQIIRDDAPAKK